MAIIKVVGSTGNINKFAAARQRMLSRDLQGRGITDPNVLAVMSEIRREEFVPEEYQSQAYADGPLPIGLGQTISQPYIVALMTQELQLDSDSEVLEIGTGSGYQTAILCRLSKKVYTIEKLGRLSRSAQEILGKLGIENVEFYIGDGSCGWPIQRLFDRIIVTAAVPKIPEPLGEQLYEGGLMVVPVGSGWVQQLLVYEKKRRGFSERVICDVRFVKLLGEYGFQESD
jgi:protein-L-isoaspartate(D-aspartate) O-methyltransferase